MRKAILSVTLFALLLTFATAQSVPAGGIISAEKAKQTLDTDKSAVLLDVRTEREFTSGRIPGARLLPYDAITAESAKALIPEKTSTVIVYCRSGRRSAIAAKALQKLGYRVVYDLGGIQNWPYGTVR